MIGERAVCSIPEQWDEILRARRLVMQTVSIFCDL
jgi:hypothetical protein